MRERQLAWYLLAVAPGIALNSDSLVGFVVFGGYMEVFLSDLSALLIIIFPSSVATAIIAFAIISKLCAFSTKQICLAANLTHSIPRHPAHNPADAS